jgi:uncharacterized damage-inducible protein DinB
MKQGLIAQLKSAQQFFNKTIECLDENDSQFAPKPELYTVAAHVEHCAHTVEWFIEGAFGKGWDMDFVSQTSKNRQSNSLEKAKNHFDQAIAKAIETIEKASDKTLMEKIPNDQIMGGASRLSIVGGIVDHTAHHRGSLAVYARLLGKEPSMPYA